MIVDKTYWGSELPLPLSPSDSDVEVYKNYLKKGTTLMLGCTKKLIPLSDRQLDIDSWYNGNTVIKGDWVDNQNFYNNIIIDGGLNLNKKLCDNTIKMASKNCEVFISRSFKHKLDTMKVATHFPKASDFKIIPKEVVVYDDYFFYIWEF
jgi:hypothetical protein